MKVSFLIVTWVVPSAFAGALFCNVVDKAVALYHASSTASVYCSSYLDIQTSTVTRSLTQTSTIATTTPTTTTVTIVDTMPTTIVIVSTIYTATSTYTSTLALPTTDVISTTTSIYTLSLDTACSTVTAAPVRRDSHHILPDSFNSRLSPGHLISPACNCLSLTTPITYITSTSIIDTTTTVATPVTVYQTTTVLSTVVSTSTIYEYSVTTTTASDVSTVVSTTTVAPAYCTDSSKYYLSFCDKPQDANGRCLDAPYGQLVSPSSSVEFIHQYGEWTIVNYSPQSMLYVDDGIDGGRIFASSNPPASSSPLRCVLSSSYSDAPIYCYNSAGTEFMAYEVTTDNYIHVGLTVPPGATSITITQR